MKRKYWIALGTVAFCGPLVYLVASGYPGLALVISAIVAYCVAAYYAAEYRADRRDADEAARSSRREAREYARRHMEDRRRSPNR